MNPHRGQHRGNGADDERAQCAHDRAHDQRQAAEDVGLGLPDPTDEQRAEPDLPRSP